MYESKYYTCEEIDERLLQGYYDDAVARGFTGSLDDWHSFIRERLASTIKFDNTVSGVPVETVQDVIDLILDEATFDEDGHELSTDIEETIMEIFNRNETQRQNTFNSKEAQRDQVVRNLEAAVEAGLTVEQQVQKNTAELATLGSKIGAVYLDTNKSIVTDKSAAVEFLGTTAVNIPKGSHYMIHFHGWDSAVTSWRPYVNGTALTYCYVDELELVAEEAVSSIRIWTGQGNWKDDAPSRFDISIVISSSGIEQEVSLLSDSVKRNTKDIIEVTSIANSLKGAVNKTPNLYNKNSTLNKKGYYGRKTYVEDATYSVTHPIPVLKDVSYKCLWDSNSLPSNNWAVYCDENGNILSYFNVDNANGYSTFTATQDGFVSLNIGTLDVNIYMVCKQNEYPAKYVGYGYKLEDQTPLTEEMSKEVKQIASQSSGSQIYGKKVLFVGDSICAANELANIGVEDGGWARRIGESQNLTFKNVAIGGQVVTENLYNSSGALTRSILTKFNVNHSELPNAEYTIFDIGTNDADVIGMIVERKGDGLIGLKDRGAYPSAFGAFNDTDFSGDYNTDTFCGAFEKYIHKTLTTYKGMKVGYIVAPKMALSVVSDASYLRFANRKAYYDVAVAICKKWGVPVLNLWEDAWTNPYLTEHYNPSMSAVENNASEKYYIDGQHPTVTCYDYISPIIEKWMSNL